MSVFDADEYLNSLDHPSVKVDGVTYTGRILNLEEWLPFYHRLQLLAGKNDQAAYIRFMREYLRLVFPQTTFLPWNTPIWKRILNHPLAERIVTDFLALQVAGLKGDPRHDETPES